MTPDSLSDALPGLTASDFAGIDTQNLQPPQPKHAEQVEQLARLGHHSSDIARRICASLSDGSPLVPPGQNRRAQAMSEADSGQASEAPESDEFMGDFSAQSHEIGQPYRRMEELPEAAPYGPQNPAPRARLSRWQALFCASLQKQRNITVACRAARVSREYAFESRGANKFFAQCWKDAAEERVDGLLEGAFAMAEGGDPRMTEFLLKNLRREEFGDKLDINVSGALAHVALSAADVARIVGELHPELAPKALPSQSQG